MSHFLSSPWFIGILEKISKDHNMLQNTVFSTFHCAYSELSRQFYVDKIMWQERWGHVTVTRRFLIQSDRLRSLEFTWTFEFSNFRLKFSTIVKSLPIFWMYFAIRVYDDKNRQNKSRDLEMLLTNENQARLVLANQRPTQ